MKQSCRGIDLPKMADEGGQRRNCMIFNIKNMENNRTIILLAMRQSHVVGLTTRSSNTSKQSLRNA